MQALGGHAIFLATFAFQGLITAIVIWRITVRAAPITKAVYRWAGWERGLTTETIRLDPRAAEEPAK
jgi:hypothetical protein